MAINTIPHNPLHTQKTCGHELCESQKSKIKKQIQERSYGELRQERGGKISHMAISRIRSVEKL